MTRRFGDFAAAEDAVQEACVAAATQWPRAGFPADCLAWLTHVAFRRMTDHIRSETARRAREEAVAELESSSTVFPDVDDEHDKDDTLMVLFMCAHPALTPASAIALTLRAVGGLTTSEIAHSFLTPEPTMAQRISRAKQRIKESNIPFALPEARDIESRTRAVQHVLYLVFNEGYASTSGEALQRVDLAAEAIRLTRLLYDLRPANAETAGLLALMLLTDARRFARTGPGGELIPLNEQDRTLWDKRQIDEGIAILSHTLPKGSAGPYQLQAAIAAVHDEAESFETTDWPQILELYELLRRLSENPMVTLNYAIADAMVRGAAHGLRILSALDRDSRIAGHYRLDATRAHLFEIDGAYSQAVAHYRRAAGKTGSLPERNYLLSRASRLSERHNL